ncbi:MAG: hypothetical protein NC927_00480 [Candidatus Omnitrophica bacterium]|nr:hypothetical protein [Candidatus Omnitrophota bacterium]
MLTRRQRSFLRFWISTIIISKGILFLLNRYLILLYAIISFLFFLGFSLRILNLYPGEKEPLILDGLAVLIGILFVFLAGVFASTKLRFLLIALSFFIVLPHLVYIVKDKDI